VEEEVWGAGGAGAAGCLLINRPEPLQPLTTQGMEALDELLDGVVYDREEALDEEFELP